MWDPRILYEGVCHRCGCLALERDDDYFMYGASVCCSHCIEYLTERDKEQESVGEESEDDVEDTEVGDEQGPPQAAPVTEAV